MRPVSSFAWGSVILLSLSAAAHAQSALSGEQEGFGDGRFGGGSLISSGSGEETGQAILDQATGSSGSAFNTGAGGSIFGEGLNAQSVNNVNGLATLGAFGLRGAGGFNQQRQGLNQQQTTSPLRVPLRLSSELRTNLTGRSQFRVTAFEKRLTKLPGLAQTRSVAIVLDGRTAILQGVVSTPRQRDLIARLIMLEPGVSQVKNELQVGTPTAPQTLPLP